ncbi:hypothetical protein F6J84_12570 [Microbacterium caowuchunii]|uniref:hypothetical protein n=1 Tax=Microbacterium caowuchunii TaxID=2614638 RepID=UPI0012456098|nr:hypothetical protein [Microbacterium caowuchunii]QEW00854.1 hypothetical protein F6J84_12570 [Microbacterium caowuchunii]
MAAVYERFCIDGAQSFNGNVPLGYSRNDGPEFRFGVYSNDMTGQRLVEFNQPEFGAVNIWSRITAP